MTTPLDSSYREIDLGKGRVAIVDAKNFERLNKHNWYAWWNKHVKGFYAVRHEPKPGGGQRTVYMHREVLGLKYGDPRRADHKNPALTLVNTRKNLRRANFSQSQMNRRLKAESNSTGHVGIQIYSKWSYGPTYQASVQWTKNGKQRTKTKACRSLDEAKEARRALLVKYHKDFARMN